ncbi:MAG: DNA repair protein RadC [Lachnospiraceae bacterium]|nr:DNA repair protein RadC [Lachnospiraceae bacterium]
MFQEQKTMKELPKSEQPYEKFLQYGPESLSEAELLAVILRTGTKGISVLSLSNYVLGMGTEKNILNLERLTLSELKKIPGIGQIKAVQIKCIAELSKRFAKAERRSGLSFHSPKSIAEYYMEEFRLKTQEHMLLIMLNTKSVLIGEKIIFKGTVNASIVSPREIFIEAIQQEAVYIILLHNHPSGDPTPSREDIALTKRIKEAGRLMDIQLIDHIIIGDHRYVSFSEKDLL